MTPRSRRICAPSRLRATVAGVPLRGRGIFRQRHHRYARRAVAQIDEHAATRALNRARAACSVFSPTPTCRDDIGAVQIASARPCRRLLPQTNANDARRRRAWCRRIRSARPVRCAPGTSRPDPRVSRAPGDRRSGRRRRCVRGHASAQGVDLLALHHRAVVIGEFADDADGRSRRAGIDQPRHRCGPRRMRTPPSRAIRGKTCRSHEV